MVRKKSRRKVIRVLSKGHLSIPREFLEALGITNDNDTLVGISLAGDHLEISPIEQGGEILRALTEDADRFLEECKLEPPTVERMTELFRQGRL